MNEEPKEVGGIDDLFEQMKRDEIADAAEQSDTIKPTAYAKLRGIWPQRVYQAIRTHKIWGGTCDCGSTVISLSEADMVFGFKKDTEDAS